MTPSNRATTTAAVTGPAATTRGGGGGGGGGGIGGGGGGRGNKVRQTMNGIDIQQNPANNYEEKLQNGSENVPPAPVKTERGETKQSTIPPEKMETVSKGTGASKLNFFLNPLL